MYGSRRRRSRGDAVEGGFALAAQLAGAGAAVGEGGLVLGQGDGFVVTVGMVQFELSVFGVRQGREFVGLLGRAGEAFHGAEEFHFARDGVWQV
ncbi:hypothetical protein BFW38_05680 [Terasakiispira papahanaumokuakeensis]|uniref:Uncharacterized protein n=1 Tax=Terasakiispira papahanaumokuakeensis TaxID=197479 RepID=A0A1E2V7W8_9GAMM|nr:hypothetical protein [Terasakiispira papahanaumokuakeensis]ODC03110.1 hypothetical protein BFW38_05680 [Terasakiispira papahanaumokuakeensis]